MNKAEITLMQRLNVYEDKPIWHVFYDLLEEGWHIEVRHGLKRGVCYEDRKLITLPYWLFGKADPEYCIYYLAHEMAHATAGCKANHGPVFMKELERLCPRHLLHYELEYKPRNAMAAGIMPQDF
jgi:hypothetical protein